MFKPAPFLSEQARLAPPAIARWENTTWLNRQVLWPCLLVLSLLLAFGCATSSTAAREVNREHATPTVNAK